MRFKKTLLLLSMAVTLSATAGVYQCKKGDVSLPCEFNGWALGGDALYLQPTGLMENSIGVAGVQSWNREFNWGFRIEAARYFGHKNDFNVNWAYFNQNQSFIDNGGVLYNNPGQAFISGAKMSVVNLELGQQVDFGEKWEVRMHGGMQIDHLTSQFNTTLIGGQFLRTFNKFQMLGARAGLDTRYHLWEGLAFYANGALGALYGHFDIGSSNLAGIPRQTPTTAGVAANITVSNLNQSFVSVDYNVGLSYAHLISQGELTARIGWTDYTWVGNLAIFTVPAWQGLVVGAKWVGNA